MSKEKTSKESVNSAFHKIAVVGSFYWVKPYRNNSNYEPAKCKIRDKTETLWFSFTDGSVMRVDDVSDYKELNFR